MCQRNRFLIPLLLVTGVLAATALAGPRPRLAPIRQAENWAPLADPALRTEPLDGLKYIGLGAPQRFLSLGAEVRLLNEYYENEDWGDGPQLADGSWLLRTLVHADAHLGRRVRIYGQLGSGLESGRVGGPRPADEADLYLNALFLEVGRDLDDGSRLDLRLGRMELSYGWGRLICFRGRPTLKRSHDGGLVRWAKGKRRTDLFLTWDVRRQDGVFASERRDDFRLLGLYHTQPLGGGHSADVYVLNSDRAAQAYYLDPASPAPTSAPEDRTSLGARWEYRRGIFYTDLEATYQLGSIAPAGRPSLAISALGLGTMTRLRWQQGWQPELGLDLGYTSGDGDPADGTLGTFRSPAPGAFFLGGGHYFGYGNLGLAHLFGAFRPVAPVRVQAGGFLFWRDQQSDGSYALPGRPYLPPADSSELGWTPELIVTWQVAPYTTLEIEVTPYAPADYQDLVTAGEDMLFVSSKLTFLF